MTTAMAEVKERISSNEQSLQGLHGIKLSVLEAGVCLPLISAGKKTVVCETRSGNLVLPIEKVFIRR